VHGNRLFVFEARANLALEHAREAVVSAELYDFGARKFIEPLAVVADFGFLRIENFENLVEIGFCVGVHSSRESGGRVSERPVGRHHGGKIADQKNGGVAMS